ncbi:MAG TPA: glycosyltransferase family 2 protein [Bacteroidia bacterium]|jgi:glycosyltransferase involved in cell wall biosynthesis|nr:glycosyltransferase family 2 protein [Bacteroidia bacterium]
MVEFSVIIPIYNEELNIPNLLTRLRPVVEKTSMSYELLFINDGSSDKSLQLIKVLAQADSHVRYIDFSRNFGHQVAVTAGIDHCKGNIIAIIDADLQDPPELIEEMIALIKQGNEVVYAKRRSRKDKNILKKAAYKTFYRLLARISNVEVPLDTGDFRVMTRKVAEVLKNMPEQHKFLRGQIAWLGFKQTFVEYDRDVRAAGEPGYTYKKLFKLAFDGITGFSNVPLRIATIMGFVVSGISLALILYALVGYFFFKSEMPKGWASLMIAISFIGGVQLICIGIIGEYISRLQTDIRNRPLYIVNETNC